jgi:hypothetical protein
MHFESGTPAPLKTKNNSGTPLSKIAGSTTVLECYYRLKIVKVLAWFLNVIQ